MTTTKPVRYGHANLPRPTSAEDLPALLDIAAGDDDRFFGLPMTRDWVPIAFFPASANGVNVVVSGSAAPAMFYRIAAQVEDSPVFSTGSSMHGLSFDLAVALANGDTNLDEVALVINGGDASTSTLRAVADAATDDMIGFCK